LRENAADIFLTMAGKGKVHENYEPEHSSDEPDDLLGRLVVRRDFGIPSRKKYWITPAG